MKNNSLSIIAIILAAILFIGLSSVFTVHQHQTAIKFLFGEVVGGPYQPGLHFKMPLLESVRKFDQRILTLDRDPERYLTAEKKNVQVDYFVKWRIADTKNFYVTTRGEPEVANRLLDQTIKDGLRAEFSKRQLREVISGDRDQIMNVLTETANEQAASIGINVVDVRIKRIDLPEDVSESVFSRMRAERERVAKDFRSRGREKAEIIRAEADRKRRVMLSEAYRDAETQRGEGDAIATENYAKAYNQDKDFYSFHRSLNAYRESFKGSNGVLILDPDSDFFKFFNQSK